MAIPLRLRALACVSAALCAGWAQRAQSQQFSSPNRDPAQVLLRDTGDEARRGIYLFYTQAYKDQHKQKVSLHGSVYGVLRDVKLTGCDLEATVQVVDLFSGFIGEGPVAERQDLTEYSIHLRVTSALAANVFQARPSQLAHTMHTQCDGDGSCTFNWVRIHAPRALMHERIVLNHAVTFDGPVSEVLAPISSKEAGEQLVRDLNELAESICR
jgi:hypothetical protein